MNGFVSESSRGAGSDRHEPAMMRLPETPLIRCSLNGASLHSPVLKRLEFAVDGVSDDSSAPVHSTGPVFKIATRKAKSVMSNEAKLVVEPRTEMGSANCRRLLKRGVVPGNVYGHNADAMAVMVSAEVLNPVIKSGSRVVDLEVAGKHDKAVIRDVQWDVFGRYIKHFDLLRVDPNERVTITVPIVLKGTAPGVAGGGLLDQPMHSLVIDCLAYQIPDSIQVRVGTMQMGDIVHVRDLPLPDGSHPHAQPDAIVVHVVKLQVSEVEAAVPGVAEPEVVGKKPTDADAKDEKKDDKKKK